jgi:hypothetical protein
MYRAPRGPISRNSKHIALSCSGPPQGERGFFNSAKPVSDAQPNRGGRLLDRQGMGRDCVEAPAPGKWLGLEPTRARERYDVPKTTARSLVMILLVGTKVRFLEQYRPPQVRWGAVGVIVDMEERLSECWVRARFGDFLTAWIEARQLEPVS